MNKIHVEKSLGPWGWGWAIFNGDKLLEVYSSKRALTASVPFSSMPQRVRARRKELEQTRWLNK